MSKPGTHLREEALLSTPGMPVGPSSTRRTYSVKPEPYRLAFIDKLKNVEKSRRRWQLIAGLSWGMHMLSGFVMAGAVKSIPVIVFNEGRPLLFEDTTTPRNRLDDMRIESFADQFVRRFVGINSGNVDEDIAASLNMMTPRYQKVTLQDGSELKRRAPYRNGDMKSTFTQLHFKVGPYSASDMDAKINVTVWGQIVFTPKFSELADGPRGGIKQFFITPLVLVREPMTRDNIHGLAVENSRTYMFDNEADLKLHIMRQQ